MFQVDNTSKTPIFEQLQKQICEFISIGIMQPHDKLPSVRSVASSIGVNPNTVSKAYQELEAQGFIYSMKGKGCFVADNQSDQLIKTQKLNELKDVLMDLKKHSISKEDISSLIEEIYKELTI